MKDCRELQGGQRSGETEAKDRAAAGKETLHCRSGGQSNANYRPPAAETRPPSANRQGGRAPACLALFVSLVGVPSGPAVLAYERRGIIDRTGPLWECSAG